MREDLVAILCAPWRRTRAAGTWIKSEGVLVKLDPIAALEANEAALALRVPVAEFARRAIAFAVAQVRDAGHLSESEAP